MANQSQTSVPVGELSAPQFLMLVSNAFTQLGWKDQEMDETYVKAQTETNASSWGEEITVTVNGTQADIVSKCTTWQLTDWGRNKKNVNRLVEAIEFARTQHTPEQLQEQHDKWRVDVERALNELKERFEQDKLTANDKLAFGVGGYYVTYTLIGINILIFIAMLIGGVHVLNPTGEDILNWGGNMRAYTASGEWWRLVTCVFVHIGIIHLLFNTYALYIVGTYLEPVIGRWNFLGAYLATGVLASVTSLWWSADRVSAGASGAIFGMYGFFLALLTSNYLDKRARQALMQSILVFVGFNLLYGLKAGIDNAAHVGGLLSGFVMGYIFYFIQKRNLPRTVFIGIAAAITLFVSISVLKDKNDDSVKFSKLWDRFVALEQKGLQPMQNRDSLTSAEFIQQAESISMPAWKEGKQMMTDAQNYNLPANMADQRSMLNKYIDLRMQQTQLWIKAEKENDGSYYKQIDSLTKEIDALIDGFSKSK